MKNRLYRLHSRGDILVEWDPDNEQEVAKAEAEFNKLKEAGFLFFATREVPAFDPKDAKLSATLGAEPTADEKPEPTKEFKRRAKKTVAVPRMAGG